MLKYQSTFSISPTSTSVADVSGSILDRNDPITVSSSLAPQLCVVIMISVMCRLKYFFDKLNQIISTLEHLEH